MPTSAAPSLRAQSAYAKLGAEMTVARLELTARNQLTGSPMKAAGESSVTWNRGSGFRFVGFIWFEGLNWLP